MVSRVVADNLKKASWIRRMFEEGARLKAERGADKVFDFTLGNPEIEPRRPCWPPRGACSRAIARHLHAYMPNAGHPRVREGRRQALQARQACPTPRTTCS